MPHRELTETLHSLLDSDDHDFISTLRMSKESFRAWKREVEEFSPNNQIQPGELPLDVMLAIHLQVLGGRRQRDVARLWGLSESQVKGIFTQVSRAIAGEKNRFIRMPSWDNQPVPPLLQEPENRPLRDCWGIMGVFQAGFMGNALDVTSYGQLFEKQVNCTTTTLCVCNLDPEGQSKFIFVGEQLPEWESVDSNVESALDNGLGVSFPPDKFFIADDGFKMAPWLVTPYPITEDTTGWTEEQLLLQTKRINFNHLIGRLRARIERNFGVLRTKFQLLCRDNDFVCDHQADIITSAFCLFNFLKSINYTSFDTDRKNLDAAVARGECTESGVLMGDDNDLPSGNSSSCSLMEEEPAHSQGSPQADSNGSPMDVDSDDAVVSGTGLGSGTAKSGQGV